MDSEVLNFSTRLNASSLPTKKTMTSKTTGDLSIPGPFLGQRHASKYFFAYCAWVFLTLLPTLTSAQKPTLTPEDYGRWEYLQAGRLSPDGTWVHYAIRKVNGDRELHITPVDEDTTQIVPWGESPVFSADSKWLAWQVGFSEEEEKRLKKDKKPLYKKVVLLNLRTGEKQEFEGAKSFVFDATSNFLAVQGYPPKELEGKGSDLRLIALEALTETTFGNVGEFVWSPRESWIAMSIATGNDAGNGIQAYSAASSQLLSLDASGSEYTQLSWHEEDLHLAGLRSTAIASKDTTSFELMVWKNMASESPESNSLIISVDSLELVRHRKPDWSDDGTRISFGVRLVEPSTEDSPEVEADGEEEKDLAGLQIWHSSDVRIYPQQKAASSRDDSRSLLSVWDLENGQVIHVSTNLLARTSILEGWQFAIERTQEKYAWGEMFGRPYHDIWLTDLSNGTRELILEKVRYSWESAGGKYLLWYDGKDYLCYNIESGERTNITETLSGNFVNEEYDTPTDQLPPYGIGGWLKGEEGILIYDKYDIWNIRPDGSGGIRLTDGSSEEIIHRISDVYRDEEFIDADRPQFISLHGEWTEKRGYAQLDFDGGADHLVYEDRRISSLYRADSTDVFIYGSQARDDSPDLFVTAIDFRKPKQITNTNPWLKDYAWTKSELIEFQSEAGVRLQTGLLYPVNYKKGKRYPMIVYTYEVLSPGIHNFEPPNMRDYYNFTAWTQNGYFVLLPDIKYRPRDPGISAIEAVRPAIQKVVEMGFVDEAKVGLIGHSWGGYQATYLPTRTKLFAASVAGAPLTDFVSFMGQIHWNPGIPEVDHWETGQARMEVPFWEDPEAHYRNSPIHKIHELETPILMAFGNEDGVVDWDQGTEFYNFARRAGKQMVLLVYEGEDHGFRQKANQMDYHQRILEWFDHYLKGDPAADWITEGVSLKDHEKEINRLSRPKE